MGDVRGKLLYKDKPVTTGIITFMPVLPDNQMEGGRVATGIPNENGEFRLTTNAPNDGALVGKHRVVYGAPNIPETDNKEVLAKQMKLAAQFGKAKVPAGLTIDVKPGRNDIEIKLVD